MNNILNFEQYKENIKLNELVAYQIESERVDEGLKTFYRKFRAKHFVARALKEEIEQGKKFEELVKNSISSLQDIFKELDKKGLLKGKSDTTKQIEKWFNDINEITFDTMSLLGNGDIDFNAFLLNATLANVINFGVIFAPIRNVWMLKKSYNYFMGLIKNTIRKDLILLQVNFDRFQNTIMKSVDEMISDNSNVDSYERALKEGEQFLEDSLKKMFGDKNWEKFIKDADNYEKTMKKYRERRKLDKKQNPYNNIWDKIWDNTYTTTADAIKSYSSEDSQKQLDAIKNSVSKISHGDDELTVYGELLLSSAEEIAMRVSFDIHSNFLKMSEVFKLTNQKKLVEIIELSEKEAEKEKQEESEKIKSDELKKKADESIKDGEKLFGKHKSRMIHGGASPMRIDEWLDIDEDERNKITSYLVSDSGKKDYSSLTSTMKMCVFNPKKNHNLNTILETLTTVNIVDDGTKLVFTNRKEFVEIFKMMEVIENASVKGNYKLIDKDKRLKILREYLRLIKDFYSLRRTDIKNISTVLNDILTVVISDEDDKHNPNKRDADGNISKPNKRKEYSLKIDGVRKRDTVDFFDYIRKIVNNDYIKPSSDEGEDEKKK